MEPAFLKQALTRPAGLPPANTPTSLAHASKSNFYQWPPKKMAVQASNSSTSPKPVRCSDSSVALRLSMFAKGTTYAGGEFSDTTFFCPDLVGDQLAQRCFKKTTFLKNPCSTLSSFSAA